MMFTEKIFQDHLSSLTDQHHFVVAYSGGLDSQVLLYTMATLCNETHWKVRAIHVNHGLSSNSQLWLDHCEQSCQALNIPFSFEKLNIHRIKSQSLEAQAREARYAAFAKNLEDNEVLLTAHHQDDQAETVLLQLFRGCGTQGLAAMPEVSRFAKSLLLRPLLNFDRKALLDFAIRNNLQWVEDESNFNQNFSRNFIRHELMPIIRKKWPSISTTLSRTARHCAETNHLLQNLLPEEVKLQNSHKLSVSFLTQYDSLQQRNILRFWIQQNNVTLPNTSKLLELQRTMLVARIDANPCVKWSGVAIRRHRDELYLVMDEEYSTGNTIILWDMSADLQLPNNLGCVKLDFLKTELPLTKLHSITIRFRRGGERCKVKNRKGTHKLKKLFQEWGVPTWQRDRVPLIYMQDELIAVYPYCACI